MNSKTLMCGGENKSRTNLISIIMSNGKKKVAKKAAKAMGSGVKQTSNLKVRTTVSPRPGRLVKRTTVKKK